MNRNYAGEIVVSCLLIHFVCASFHVLGRNIVMADLPGKLFVIKHFLFFVVFMIKTVVLLGLG